MSKPKVCPLRNSCPVDRNDDGVGKHCGEHEWSEACDRGADQCPACVEVEKRTSHTETIRCPSCLAIQEATVDHTTWPFDTYVHNCQCGYIITESEWDKVEPLPLTPTAPAP